MKNIKTMRSIKQIALLAFLGLGLPSCAKDDHDKEPQPVTTDYHQTAVTKFKDAEGITYAYRELGEKTGIPVLMLSPLAGNMDDWDPAITNGLAANYKVILLDIEGVGLSGGKTPDSIAGMARGVVSFVHALGLQKVNLLGFSMGSFMAQQIALTEPGLVNKIILTGTGPKGATGLSNLPNLLAAAANLSAEESFLKFGFTNSGESTRLGRLAYGRIQKRVADRDVPVSNESAGAQVHAVLGWAQPDAAALDELKSVKQPVLIAQGEQDVPVPVENAVHMSQSLPDARLIIYQDAAHAAMFQNAETFVREATAFLAE
jgi:pimeloyl-ACP methyl ester carboxylesterase